MNKKKRDLKTKSSKINLTEQEHLLLSELAIKKNLSVSDFIRTFLPLNIYNN